MAESAFIRRVRIKHSAVMDFMLANPTMPQHAVAAYFGITEPWLSTVINSHAFQAELKRRQEKLFDNVIIPIRQQVEGVARLALDKIEETLQKQHVEPAFALQVVDKTLPRLMPSSPAVVVNNTDAREVNFTQVNATVLARARAVALQRGGQQVEQETASSAPRNAGMLDFRSSAVPGEEDS